MCTKKDTDFNVQKRHMANCQLKHKLKCHLRVQLKMLWDRWLFDVTIKIMNLPKEEN
jgi:hypothetical protein